MWFRIVYAYLIIITSTYFFTPSSVQSYDTIYISKMRIRKNNIIYEYHNTRNTQNFQNIKIRSPAIISYQSHVLSHYYCSVLLLFLPFLIQLHGIFVQNLKSTSFQKRTYVKLTRKQTLILWNFHSMMNLITMLILNYCMVHVCYYLLISQLHHQVQINFY